MARRSYRKRQIGQRHDERFIQPGKNDRFPEGSGVPLHKALRGDLAHVILRRKLERANFYRRVSLLGCMKTVLPIAASFDRFLQAGKGDCLAADLQVRRNYEEGNLVACVFEVPR
jgi:hypothetical protein